MKLHKNVDTDSNKIDGLLRKETVPLVYIEPGSFVPIITFSEFKHKSGKNIFMQSCAVDCFLEIAYSVFLYT